MSYYYGPSTPPSHYDGPTDMAGYIARDVMRYGTISAMYAMSGVVALQLLLILAEYFFARLVYRHTTPICFLSISSSGYIIDFVNIQTFQGTFDAYTNSTVFRCF